jgi:hypothetical protein
MKTSKQLVSTFILPALLLAGCGGSSKENSESVKFNDMEIKHNEIIAEDGTKGFKGDFDNTNLQTIYEGLTFEKAYLVDGDNKKIEGEEVPLNSKFSIVIEGIKNYTLKEGKAFPKLTIMMTGETGLVVGEDDLLASYTEGMSLEDAAVLRGTFTVAEPMVAGKVYTCLVGVTDKNNEEATIQSTWLFTVK